MIEETEDAKPLLLGDDPRVLDITRQMIRLATSLTAEGRLDELVKVQAFLREILSAVNADEDAKK